MERHPPDVELLRLRGDQVHPATVHKGLEARHHTLQQVGYSIDELVYLDVQVPKLVRLQRFLVRFSPVT